MVEFVPFPAYRPAMGAGVSIGELVSPPVDSISDDMLAHLRSNGRNVVNLSLAADADGRYRGAGEKLRGMIADGSLKQDPPSFYIYEQEFGSGDRRMRRRAVVGLLKLEERSTGNILPHEGVSQRTWKDREANIADTGADVECILCISEGGDGGLSERIRNSERLLYRYSDPEGTEHRFLAVSDPDICSAVTAHMKDRRVLIADGHHRYEAALSHSRQDRSEGAGYVMCAMVPAESEGIAIGAFHRMVDAGDIGETSAIKKLSKRTKMTETDAEGFAASLGEHGAGIVFRSGRYFFSDPTEPEIGAVFADKDIINGVYKADEGKSKITVTADADAAIASAIAKEHDVSVILNPPSLSEITDTAAKGRAMPRKSTYFFPKIWSGWVFYIFGKN